MDMNRIVVKFLIANQGKKYKLGSAADPDPKSMFTDCLKLLLDFMKVCEVEIPTEVQGYTIENYKSMYETDKDMATATLVDFVETYFVSKQLDDYAYGDLLLFENEYSQSIGIDLGAGYLMCVDDQQGLFITRMIEGLTLIGRFLCQQASQ